MMFTSDVCADLLFTILRRKKFSWRIALVVGFLFAADRFLFVCFLVFFFERGAGHTLFCTGEH